MSKDKSIYYKGRIYLGCEKEEPEKLRPGCMCDDCADWFSYLKTLTSYLVQGSHQWKDGEEVVSEVSYYVIADEETGEYYAFSLEE